MAQYHDRLKKRFWSKISFCNHNNCETCCWEWKAGTFLLRGGYGRFSIQENKKNKRLYAHTWVVKQHRY